MKSKGRLLSIFMVFIALLLFSATSLAVNVYEMDEKGNIKEFEYGRTAKGKGDTCQVTSRSVLPEGRKYICVPVNVMPSDIEQY